MWTLSADQAAMVEKHGLQTSRCETKGRYPFIFWPSFDSFTEQAQWSPLAELYVQPFQDAVVSISQKFAVGIIYGQRYVLGHILYRGKEKVS